MIIKLELEALIEKAERRLEERREYQTEAAQLALRDMIENAKRALVKGGTIPFTGNRAFLKSSQEMEMLFAKRRYTMAPTYLKDGMVYDEYGLNPALEWFENRDLMAQGEEGVADKATYILEKSQAAVSDWRIGSDIGCYQNSAKNHLIRAMENVKRASTGDEKGKAIVKCFNALNKFQNSRILRSDVSPEDTLFLTVDGLSELKNKVKTDSYINHQYKKIEELANKYSLEYVKECYESNFKEENYEILNEKYYLWSSTGKTVNFLTPKDATYAEIIFRLPSVENEEEGLGHVWLDNVDIFSADGNSLKIQNAGFEEGEETPTYWSNCSIGNGVVSVETRAGYCGSQKKSLYLGNPTKKDQAICKYNQLLEIDGSGSYTFVFSAKIDGKLKEGLEAVVRFLDKNNEYCGEFSHKFNKKSYMSGFDFPLTAQSDSIMYAFTKDIMYAQKVKYQLLQILNDFCQGAEHWLVTNRRPDDSDAYGGVQGGRILCSIASAYSLIKEANVFIQEEKERFYELIEYMLRYMMDMRDRTELTLEGAQYNCSNWQTDMCAGTGMLMMVLDDFPNRRTWLNNANYILKAQLLMNINPDGSWPESIRYHHAALERFASYARAILHNVGEDWWQETGLTSMFGYSLKTQTPAYKYFDGKIGTPPFGDHILGDGTEFGIYGTYLEDIEKQDKELADKMYTTWELAGKPIKIMRTEAIVLDNLMCAGDSYQVSPGFSMDLSSTKELVNSGIYLFRKNYGKGKESYFSIMSSPLKVAHGHLDQGSFIIYKNSIPIVMDSGIEGYFDSSTSWHLCSYSHACLQFATKQINVEPQGNGKINLSAGTYSLERGWVDVPVSSKVLSCEVGGDIESITIEIDNPEGQGTHIRNVTIYKEYDIYVIKDQVLGFEEEILFNLPVASKESKISGDGKVYAKGHYDVDLEVHFLSKANRIWSDKGRTTPFFKTKEAIPMMEYIRATANGKEGFTVVLHAKSESEESIEIVQDAVGTSIKVDNKLIPIV